MKMASQRQQEKAVIEGDSQIVIEAIDSKEALPHQHINPIIEEIQHISAPYSLWNFVKIHRYANRCAYSVAQCAATNLIFGCIPSDLLSRCLLFIDSGKDPP